MRSVIVDFGQSSCVFVQGMVVLYFGLFVLWYVMRGPLCHLRR